MIAIVPFSRQYRFRINERIYYSSRSLFVQIIVGPAFLGLWSLLYFPMQNVLKIRLRMSSVVVAPVIASRGRRAL
jgi:hypothetical protein